jgi:hypothetical protein
MILPGRTGRSLGGLLILIAVAGCAAPSLAPPTDATPTTAPAGSSATNTAATGSPADPVADGRRADLAQLFHELVIAHPNPFLDEGEARFRARLDALSARAGDLSDAGFLVGVMELMGHRDRDGHSGAWAMAQTGQRLHAWPIWLWDFPDGLRIVAARDPNADLVGARVTAVGGTPVADARDAVEPLIPRDNPSTLRANLPIYLTLPEVLAERRIQHPGAAALTLEMPDGTVRDVDLDALPIEAFRDWIFGVYGGYPSGFPPDPDGIAIQRHRTAVIWTEPLPGGGTYVGYNEVRSTTGPEGTSIADVAMDITAATAADRAEPFIVDLRNNGGGDNNTFGPLRSAIERQALARPETIALIAGRDTFSAAGNFVTDLMTGAAADALTLVGEPPGGGLNIYGDVRVVTLESSGIVVLISTRYHERAPGHDELELRPTVPVELTWSDLAAHRDPVLDAAIEATDRSAS